MPKAIKDDPLYQSYTAAIKQRLNSQCHETMPSILHGLEKMGFHFSLSSIKDTLNPSNSTLNTVLVIALCKYWGIDSAAIFAEPDAIISSSDLTGSTGSDEKFEPIRDKNYEGTFYCYLYPRNNICDELWPATLEIHIYEQTSRATFVVTEQNSYQTAKKKQKTFTGIPYYSRVSNTVLMLLRSDFGSYCFISFKYEPYNGGRLYYRTAIFVSYSVNTAKIPRMQKLVLLDHKASDDNYDFIRGLLKMTNNHVVIRTEDLRRLCDANPDIRKFCEKFKTDLNRNKHECYIFDEHTLTSPFRPLTEQDTLDLFVILNDSLSGFFVETQVPEIIPGLSKSF